jgi:hypothetical protein
VFGRNAAHSSHRATSPSASTDVGHAGTTVAHRSHWAQPFRLRRSGGPCSSSLSRRPQSVGDFLDARTGRARFDADPVLRIGANSRSDSYIALSAVHGRCHRPTSVIAPRWRQRTARPSSSDDTSPVASNSRCRVQGTHPDDVVSCSVSARQSMAWMCACCGATPATTISLRAGARKHEVPYCAHCSAHVQASRLGVSWAALRHGRRLVMAL